MRAWSDVEGVQGGAHPDRARMGTVFILYLTHWPSDAAQLTVYRLQNLDCGEGRKEGLKVPPERRKQGD